MPSSPQPLQSEPSERFRFETLVADLASEFVHLPPEHVDGAIEDAQRRIVEALDLDRSVLWEFVDADGSLLFTHVWSRPAAVITVAGRLLLGTSVDVPAALIVSRIAGAALLSLGVASWLARDDGGFKPIASGAKAAGGKS